MLWTDLMRVCGYLRVLIQSRQWKCRGEVVLVFDDIGSYAHAQADLAKAISEQLLHMATLKGQITPFHLNGVQVRLECPQVYKTPSGETISAAEALRTGRVQINHIGDVDG